MEVKKSDSVAEVGGGIKSQGLQISRKDEGFIMSILRKKLYSDPIGTICREIASNGRDAHRAAGIPHRPIEITISNPNQLFNVSTKSIMFKDFGLGMSPQTIKEVYTQYGSSTKRDSNDFTGGFGIGSKSPFSYTDAFTVITIHKGIKYVYNLVIDESEKGECILLHSEKTAEEQGTTVIVPIKPQDIGTFEDRTIYATKFWTPQPTLINFNQRFRVVNFLLSTPEFFCTDQASGGNQITLVIDAIPYPLDFNNVNANDIDFNHGNVTTFLCFKTGELTISATRESVQYDEATKSLIKNRIKHVKDVLAKRLEDKFAKCENVFQAVWLYETLSSYQGHQSQVLDKAIFRKYSPSIQFNKVEISKIAKAFTYLQGAMFNSSLAKKPINTIGELPNSSYKSIYYGDRPAIDRRLQTILEKESSFFVISPKTIRKPSITGDAYSDKHKQSNYEQALKDQEEEVKRLAMYGLPITLMSTVELAPVTRVPGEKKVKSEWVEVVLNTFPTDLLNANTTSTTVYVNNVSFDIATVKDAKVPYTHSLIYFDPLKADDRFAAPNRIEGVLLGLLLGKTVAQVAITKQKFLETRHYTLTTARELAQKTKAKEMQDLVDSIFIMQNLKGANEKFLQLDALSNGNVIKDKIKSLPTSLNAKYTNLVSTLQMLEKSWGLKPSKEATDFMDEIKQIYVKYPMLQFIQTYDDAAIKKANDYIKIVNKK